MENSNDINVEKQGQKQTFPSLPFCVCASFPPLCLVCSLCPLCPLETQGHKWTQSDTNGHTWPQRTQVDACRGTCTVHMWHSNLWQWTMSSGHAGNDIRSILNNLPGNLSLDITMEILKPLIKQIKIRLFFQVFNGRDALWCWRAWRSRPPGVISFPSGLLTRHLHHPSLTRTNLPGWPVTKRWIRAQGDWHQDDGQAAPCSSAAHAGQPRHHGPRRGRGLLHLRARHQA